MATKKSTKVAVRGTVFGGKADEEMVKVLQGLYTSWLEEFGSGDFPMATWCELTGVKYSRVWQIARRWYLEDRQPELIVDPRAATATWKKAHPNWTPGSAKDSEVLEALSPIVKALRQGLCSWGEINVRLGVSEGLVRRAFSYHSPTKDKGLRIGKGGAFAYADQLLYNANMKAEGAQIPAEYRGKPKPEECLNYRPEGQPRRRASRARKAA